MEYEMLPAAVSIFEDICVEPGAWTEGSLCAVASGNKGCMTESVLGTFNTGYVGSSHSTEFWAETALEDSSETHEEHQQEVCGTVNTDGLSGAWTTAP